MRFFSFGRRQVWAHLELCPYICLFCLSVVFINIARYFASVRIISVLSPLRLSTVLPLSQDRDTKFLVVDSGLWFTLPVPLQYTPGYIFHFFGYMLYVSQPMRGLASTHARRRLFFSTGHLVFSNYYNRTTKWFPRASRSILDCSKYCEYRPRCVVLFLPCPVRFLVGKKIWRRMWGKSSVLPTTQTKMLRKYGGGRNDRNRSQ